MASAATHPELRLLLACASLAPDATRVRECAAADLCWDKVVDAAEYHGLTPLLLRNLKQADVAPPEGASRRVEEFNGRTVRQNLLLTSELLHIVDALSRLGIEAVPLKGAVLASQIYGDLALRPFSDVDLLIKREQIEAAESVVKALGYQPERSVPSAHRERWLEQQCELTLRRSGISRAELHWDIAHPHFALRTGAEDFWARLKTAQVGDRHLLNLSDRDLLFMLIVHGTRHAWSRLMWLVDVAEFLRRSPEIEWERFLKDARDRGAERMMATALILVQETFGVIAPDKSANRLFDDRRAARLATGVLERWNEALGRHDCSDLEPTPLWRHRWIMKTREHRLQRWKYRLRVLTMVGDEEFGAARLPRMMAPAYKAVRLLNIFRKARAKGMAASAQGKS